MEKKKEEITKDSLPKWSIEAPIQMTYEEWVNNLEILSKKNDEEIKTKLINEEVNPNYIGMLKPKVEELIKSKLTKSINDIINNLEFMVLDINNMDISLIDFKKKIMFIEDLLKIKVFNKEEYEDLYDLVKTKTDDVYDILSDEARVIDQYGIFEITIKNNRIKWS